MAPALLAALLSWASAAVPPAPAGPAYDQLEKMSAEPARWTGAPDMSATNLSADKANLPAPAAPKVPPPARRVQPASKTRIGATIGFAAGFMLAESPALAVMQVPYAGKPLGGLLSLALLPAALVFGGVGWLIGRLLS